MLHPKFFPPYSCAHRFPRLQNSHCGSPLVNVGTDSYNFLCHSYDFHLSDIIIYPGAVFSILLARSVKLLFCSLQGTKTSFRFSTGYKYCTSKNPLLFWESTDSFLICTTCINSNMLKGNSIVYTTYKSPLSDNLLSMLQAATRQCVQFA